MIDEAVVLGRVSHDHQPGNHHKAVLSLKGTCNYSESKLKS